MKEHKQVLMAGQRSQWNGKKYTITDTCKNHPDVDEYGICVRFFIDGKGVWVNEKEIDVSA